MSEDLDTQKEVSETERGKFAQEIGVKGWIHGMESSRLIEGVKEGRSKISGCIMEIALYFLLFLYVGRSFSLTFFAGTEDGDCEDVFILFQRLTIFKFSNFL